MNKLAMFSVFISGVVIGSASSWYFTKKKYEQIANEEIESVKEKFSYKPSSEKKDDDEKDEGFDQGEEHRKDAYDKVMMAREKPSVSEYAKRLSKEGYTNYSSSESKEDSDDSEDAKSLNPYVISPEQFGEKDDYDQISLTYYSDHVLADENDEIMDDVEDSVGSDSLTHFGEYEDDSVYVRNDRLKVDYEILLDSRPYSNVLREKPYLGGI